MALTGAAGNIIASTTTSLLIDPLIQQINVLIKLCENRNLLDVQLNRMKGHLEDIATKFQDQQRAIPATVNNCKQRIEKEVGKARGLINRSLQLEPCHDCLLCKPKLARQIRHCLLCKPRLARQIAQWKIDIENLFGELRTDISLCYTTLGIVQQAQHQAGQLFQDVSDDDFVGLKNKDAEKELRKWLMEETLVGLIAVWGMGGVGKTTLLKKIYNHHEVKGSFEVIWVTVSQFSIIQLQSSIAETIKLDLSDVQANADLRKMKLSAALKIRKFLLILDDVWDLLDLKQLGVDIKNHKGSKVVLSTRNNNLVRQMDTDKAMQLQPLSPEEAWDLFLGVAFKDRQVPRDVEDFARNVAGECKGLPLAINVIANTMRGITHVREWKSVSREMKTVDPNFPQRHPRVESDLYNILRCSYDRLSNDECRQCFLYCAMYPEDKEIEVDKLVGMWVAEGILESKDPAILNDTANGYINVLVERCLFEEVKFPQRIVFLKTHDVLRDMAIYIGEKEQNCLFMAGLNVEDFPLRIRKDCKRLSLYGNNVTRLPSEGLKCPKLVSLILRENNGLEDIPEEFLSNLHCLRVLDLSGTKIKALPASLWKLTQVKFLDLSHTEIETVPEDIKKLSQLQFLDLSGCSRLQSWPSHLKGLKDFRVSTYNVTL